MNKQERKPILHELKTWSSFYAPLARGTKKFELRKNDRDFQIGDMVQLKEYDPNVDYYTGRYIIARINYILLTAESMGLKEGYCIFCFEIIENHK